MVFHYQPQKIVVEAVPEFKEYIQKKLSHKKSREEGKALEQELIKLIKMIKQQIAQLPMHPEVLNRLQDSKLC